MLPGADPSPLKRCEMAGMRIRVITESEEFESLAGVWNSLLQRSKDDNSIYLTHEWLSTWWKHFGEGKKLNILLVEQDHQVIGVVPLMKSEYRIGLVKCCLLETIGSVNCNFVGVIPPEHREQAVTALLAYLEAELGHNGVVLRLTLVPEDSKFIEMLRRHGAQFSKSLVIQETVMSLAPYISLPTTWDEYYRSLGRRRRKVLRMAMRSLERAHSVGFQVCTAQTPEDWLGKFFDLHQRRWQSVNVSGIFRDAGTREFYRDLANRFLEKNWLHFTCLTADDEMVSAEYSFVYNRKYYSATAARDIRYSKYSVGHLHYVFLIKAAIENGLQEFDFLKGDEPYKFYWTTSARRYMRIVIIKKGLFPGLRLKSIRAFLRLHELRQYGLRELYSLYMMKRREKKEKKRMGLLKKFE